MLDYKTNSKNILTKTQVSKTKAAIVHALLKHSKTLKNWLFCKVLFTLRHSKIHTKETQVSKPKLSVVHAKVSLTLKT